LTAEVRQSVVSELIRTGRNFCASTLQAHALIPMTRGMATANTPPSIHGLGAGPSLVDGVDR
jgi:hypothetical protein